MGSANRAPVPGRITELLLRLLLSAEEREALLSELHELWERRVTQRGEVEARRWYARQLRAFPVRLLLERLSGWIGYRRDASVSPRAHRDFADGFGTEVKHALRGWLRTPVVGTAVVLTFGLGLGASTAVFAVVHAVLLEPLPYQGSDRLVRIYHAVGSNRWNLSVADFQAIESMQTRFDGVAAHQSDERTLLVGGEPERVRVRAVTEGWFDLLGVRPAIGRTFRPGEGEPGSPATALVSWGFWQRRLDGDPSALGRTILLDGRPFTVVGVLSRTPGPLEERFDVFPVLQLEPPTRKGPFMLTVVGRVRSGVDAAAAEAELRAINDRIFPIWQAGWQDSTSTWGAMPLDEFVLGRYRTTLLVLLGAVGLVLLVAATNAAGLLTARAVRRRTELATRAALGATRGRLIRLLVIESVVLTFAAAALGVAIAAAAVGAVRAAGPDLLPRAGTITLDSDVLAFAALLACAGVLVFGLMPALQMIGSGSSVAETLRAGGRTATGTISAHRLRRTLVACEFAIAVPLLAGAALLVISFLRLQQVDPGYDTAGILTARITLSGDSDDDADARFWTELVERVEALPGVLAAGLNTGRPPREASNINNFDPLDRPTPPGATEPMAVWLVASPGYFDVMQIRLLDGRMFDARDSPELGTTSALVDRTWAENVYPGENPVGKRLYEGGCRSEECSIVNVVGVVEDVRYLGLDDAQLGAAVGTVYVPQSQWLASSSYLYVRTSGEPLLLLPSIRAVVRDLDPLVPLTDVATADVLLDDALAAPRNLAIIILAFALVALLLAVIGVYGVMSYFVYEHRNEIGVRLALGGRASQVLTLIVSRGMRPVLAGAGVGFLVALGTTRFIDRLLYGVAPDDPVTMVAVAVALVGTALVACWLPARHAARVDPARVLRHE